MENTTTEITPNSNIELPPKRNEAVPAPEYAGAGSTEPQPQVGVGRVPINGLPVISVTEANQLAEKARAEVAAAANSFIEDLHAVFAVVLEKLVAFKEKVKTHAHAAGEELEALETEMQAFYERKVKAQAPEKPEDSAK